MADDISSLKGNSARLACEEGVPVRDMPLPRWPSYSEPEIAIAVEILRSGNVNYWTGDECRHFETEFAGYHGVSHGVALANGTLALELALRVLDIGDGDEVIVTPRSYFASASCIAIRGARPVFADVDRDSQNITAQSIAEVISPKTKALLVVHLAGWPCEMSSIMDLAKTHNLRVIEDCAQAHGARHSGKPVGSFGDVAAFSFCQDKIMSTAGEGGMLITADEELWKKAWSFKDHGKSWDRVHSSTHAPGFRWLHESLGTNWRLTEIQAAIGRMQLTQLTTWLQQRRHNAIRLIERIGAIPALRAPMPSEHDYHAYYRCYAFVKAGALRAGWSRDRILQALDAEGVPGLSGSCPEIYREQAFADWGYEALPNARELGETSIAFPVHPTMLDTDIDDIATAVEKVISAAAR